MPNNFYANFFDKASSGNFNYPTNTIKMALLGTGYTPNLNTHAVYTDVSGSEITATGYTGTGTALTSKTHVVTAANSWGTTWAATTAYTLGQIVRPTSGNGFLYRASVAGTSASGQPSWPATVGATVVDSGVTWTNVGTSITVWSSAAASWPSSTITARYGVVYDSTTNALMCLIDMGSAQSNSSGTFTINPPTTGWAYTTTA